MRILEDLKDKDIKLIWEPNCLIPGLPRHLEFMARYLGVSELDIYTRTKALEEADILEPYEKICPGKHVYYYGYTKKAEDILAGIPFLLAGKIMKEKNIEITYRQKTISLDVDNLARIWREEC